jgi:AcrR family transcriptional regulator
MKEAGMTPQPIARRAGRPNAEQAHSKRQALIEAALDEFARVGFHAASLRDIAEKAAVSSRTLYNHYPDKAALFEACLDWSASQLQPAPASLSGDLQARLVTYTVAMQGWLFSPLSRRIALLIYREGGEFPRLREIAHMRFERHQVAPVAAILCDHGLGARADGVARHFVALALGEWQRRLLFGEASMDEAAMRDQAEQATAIFLHGIGHRA